MRLVYHSHERHINWRSPVYSVCIPEPILAAIRSVHRTRTCISPTTHNIPPLQRSRRGVIRFGGLTVGTRFDGCPPRIVSPYIIFGGARAVAGPVSPDLFWRRTAALDDVNEMRGHHALVKRMKLTYIRRMGWFCLVPLTSAAERVNILPRYIARCTVYALVRTTHNRTAWPLSCTYFVRSSSRALRAHAPFLCLFTVVRIAVSSEAWCWYCGMN